MDFFKIPKVIEQAQLAASFRTNSGAGVGRSFLLCGDEALSKVVVVEADRDDWDLGGKITVTDVDESVFVKHSISRRNSVGPCTWRCCWNV